jgi:hypothetical protein
MSASISPLPVRLPGIGSYDEGNKSAAVFGSGVLSIVRFGLVLVLGQIIESAVTSDSACSRRVGRDLPAVHGVYLLRCRIDKSACCLCCC